MKKPWSSRFSKREREIMDIIYQLGEASVNDVLSKVHDDPSYNTVRVTMGILEKKGHLKVHKDGKRCIYSPTLSQKQATHTALRDLLETFFQGSPSKAILTMLDMSSDKISEKDLDEIEALIRKEKEE